MQRWLIQERLAWRDQLFANVGTRWILREKFKGAQVWHPSIDISWLVPRPIVGASIRVRGAHAVGVVAFDTSTALLLVPLGTPIQERRAEKPREIELGADAQFSRVLVRATVFTEWTRDLRIFVPVPPQPSNPFTTLGRIENRGLEVEARALILDRSPFRWTAVGTLALLRNRLTSAGSGDFPLVFRGSGYREGEPFGVFLEQPMTFADTNRDGRPTPDEMTFGQPRTVGTAVPTREATLRSLLELPSSGLTLGFALEHVGGHKAQNLIALYQCIYQINCRALQDPSASLPDQVAAVAARFATFASPFLENASFTRLSEISLRWQPWHHSLSGLRAVTVSLEARNALTITGFHGPDPEVVTANAAQGSAILRATPVVPRELAVRIDFDR